MKKSSEMHLLFRIQLLINFSWFFCISLLYYIYFTTWNAGKVERMSNSMDARRNNELTITNTWAQNIGSGFSSTPSYLGCCGGVWILKHLPNNFSCFCKQHALKWVTLNTLCYIIVLKEKKMIKPVHRGPAHGPLLEAARMFFVKCKHSKAL